MTQINTFPLVWCEACGRAQEPPTVHALGNVMASDPLCCGECSEPLTLLEAAIHPASEMWQARRGSAWHHVLFLHALDGLSPRGTLWRLTGRDFAQMLPAEKS